MDHQSGLWEAIEKAIDEGEEIEGLEKRLWERFGETRAVMVLDSTGFSRATKSKGVVFFLSIIARLRRIGREAFEIYKALNWRERADNLYGDFANVDDAVAAAFSIHRRLAEEGLEIGPGDPFGACIGIGYGKLLRTEREGMYGDQMNLASKLGEDTAELGETLLTKAAYENLTQTENLNVVRREIAVSGVSVTYYSIKLHYRQQTKDDIQPLEGE